MKGVGTSGEAGFVTVYGRSLEEDTDHELS